MPSFLTCLVFILTHAVVAQADFSPATSYSARLADNQWAVTHTGNANLGDLAVEVSLEVGERQYEVPASMANQLHTFIAIEPVVRKAYRLHFFAGELKAEYDLQPELLNGDQAFREGFVSTPSVHKEYSFVVEPLDGGALRVICKRKADGARVSEFSLNPVSL